MRGGEAGSSSDWIWNRCNYIPSRCKLYVAAWGNEINKGSITEIIRGEVILSIYFPVNSFIFLRGR